MKLKSLLVAVFSLCSLYNVAEDKFFIENFSMGAGETKELEICLTNEVAYTGFQADIYIPEGLTVYQEDGEYIFDLSERKHRSHTISATLQADGAIRLLSYSTTSKDFSGTEGALIYFTITASEDFKGSHEIRIDNIKFAQNSGVETYLNPSTAIVTGPAIEEPNPTEISVTIKDAERGQVSVMAEPGSVLKLKFEAVDDWFVSSVLLNGEDVTSQLDAENCFVTPTLNEDAIINVVYADIATSVDMFSMQKISVCGYDGMAVVSGAENGVDILVYNLDGQLIKMTRMDGNLIRMSLPRNNIYIVKIGSRTFKISL